LAEKGTEGVQTACGGQWYAMTVLNVLARLNPGVGLVTAFGAELLGFRGVDV
jgi:hypothetical protein